MHFSGDLPLGTITHQGNPRLSPLNEKCIPDLTLQDEGLHMLGRAEISDHSHTKHQKSSGWSELKRKVRTRARKILRSSIITIDGIKLEVDRNHYPPNVVRALYGERYEDMEAAFVRQAVKSGDRVLEIGAGIGFISMLCARACGADAVLSYEANPANEAFIRRNFALNNLHPQFRSKAISVEKGEGVLFVEHNFLSTGFINRGNGKKMAVQCDPIDEVIREFRPNCIVMDVEGAEIDLLPAAPLGGVDKIVLETHARVVGAPAIADLEAHLQAQGFIRANPGRGKVCLYLRRAAA